LTPPRTFVGAIAVAIACGATAAHLASQERRTVWDGVYAAAQAARGREVYEETCSECHGPDFSGGEAKILRGELFMQSWAEDHLGSLFQKIRTTMPTDHPGSLSDESYLAVIAAILQANGFPAGPEALTTGSALSNIRIEGKNGPGPVPNYTMVQVVGCLDQGSGNAWVLTQGTLPVRSRNPEPSTGAALEAVRQAAPGGLTFRLMNVFPAPTAHRGHRMEVKGLLMRAADGDQLNVTSLGMVAESCPK
jgi:mono/diheme cytochrome c family protein